MTKELEKIGNIEYLIHELYSDKQPLNEAQKERKRVAIEDCKDIYKALTELQAIKEAKPETLEWLSQQIQRLNDDLQHYTMVEKDKAIEYQISEDLKELNTIKATLLKAQEDEKLKVDICEMFGLDNLFPYNDTDAILKELEEYMDRHNQLWVDFMKTSKELQAIKEAEPSEAVENLKYLKNLTKVKDVGNVFYWNQSYEKVEQALLKAEKQEKALTDMKRLTKEDFEELSDRWIFMDIVHFISDVQDGCISYYDGNGNYVYTDSKCRLYVDDEHYISFKELEKVTMFNVDNFIEKKSTDKYKLIGVFWFNK